MLNYRRPSPRKAHKATQILAPAARYCDLLELQHYFLANLRPVRALAQRRVLLLSRSTDETYDGNARALDGDGLDYWFSRFLLKTSSINSPMSDALRR